MSVTADGAIRRRLAEVLCKNYLNEISARQIMNTEVISLPSADVTCLTWKANCCRLEVLLIKEMGVSKNFIEFDDWGISMARLDDGWCAAYDVV